MYCGRPLLVSNLLDIQVNSSMWVVHVLTDQNKNYILQQIISLTFEKVACPL
jgi:hypothetical protein